MKTMYKTSDKGTLIANRFNNGISLGIYGDDNFLTLEEDKNGKLQICIDEDTCEELGIDIVKMSTVEFNQPITDL